MHGQDSLQKRLMQTRRMSSQMMEVKIPSDEEFIG
jgi:hypothetical protein